MKVLVCTDIEGVSGVTSFDDHAAHSGKYYEQARHLLTAEVNAAVEGMLAENVQEVLVVDGHGEGGIIFEQLHPAAQLFHGRPWAWSLFIDQIMPTFDAAIMIGQHAMAGCERGTLNHTQDQNSIEYYKLNGKPIGEIAQWSLCTGAKGVPMVFLSGDQNACKEAEELIPGITTATVKTGLSRTSAISFSAAEGRRRIREGIRQAIQKQRHNPLSPLVWPGPFVLEMRYFHTGSVEAYRKNPQAKIIDPQTVQLHSPNILDIIYS